jgi:hypothetical protein
MELIVLADRCVKITMTTTDGVTTMEIHRAGLDDEDVLINMSRNKFYRGFKGEWELSLPQDSRTFSGKEFTDVTSKALAFINERDNPNTYMINFF